MNKKDKELLLKELSARLSYGVMCKVEHRIGTFVVTDLYNKGNYVCGFFKEDNHSHGYHIEEVKPILRPMSTMTKEERKEMGDILNNCGLSPYGEIKASGEDNMLRCTAKQSFLFLNYMYSKHFDINHLIDEGLAYEMPEEMYK